MKDSDKISRMYELVEQWQTSGQSQKQFSEENNIKLPTFMYWIKKYRIQNQSEAGFSRIEMIDRQTGITPTPKNELELADGLLVRIFYGSTLMPFGISGKTRLFLYAGSADMRNGID